MADSKPPREANIDLVDSFARRRGTEVEIVLGTPQFDVSNDSTLVLLRGKKRLLAPISPMNDEGRRRLVAVVPRERLRNGTWMLRVRTGPDRVRVDARLLVQGDRPIVLLWGPGSKRSTLPVPHPRQDRGPGGSLKGKLDEPAAAIRRRARRVRRRD